MDLMTASATVHAFNAGPSVPAFEAVAFGRWWAEIGHHRDSRMDIGTAFNDKRFLELRREEGCRPAGTGFPIVQQARKLVRDHCTSEWTNCPLCGVKGCIAPFEEVSKSCQDIGQETEWLNYTALLSSECTECGRPIVVHA
ncbi:hypothetical protein ACIBCN_18685 [Nocardia sp. NPDC051052]|uniref:hypothetical protein n=1 Tax=Nocardia sp. NPDC051052 TaxID=3364322 RepID=UPI0037AC46D0